MLTVLLGNRSRAWGQRGAGAAVRAALLLVVLLALFLRVHRLGIQSLWYDEAVTARVGAQGVAELTRWTADDIQPPLYYYVAAGWMRLAGRSEWALRFPSAFFGVLTVALLAATGRRLFKAANDGHLPAMLAALLSSVSPLYVYYAQEARMYTLLTFLGVLAGYALLRATVPEARRSKGWWGLFVGASAAMLYTHYFGVFLLIAYGVCLLAARLAALLRGQRGAPSRRRADAQQWKPLLISAAAIFLLYLPWLPAMMNRYQADRSYWRGDLKLGEALRHVAVSFVAGAPETMLEAEAVRWLPWIGIALVAALAAMALNARSSGLGRQADGPAGGSPDSPPAAAPGVEPGQAALWLAIVLVVPLLAVLTVASRTPKFNSRYLMLVSPAFLLVMAGGASALLRLGMPGLGAGPRLVRSALCGLGGLVLALPLAVSCVGIWNWFEDPAFTKAQWRELASAVQTQMTPRDAVLLVSGHAYPAWEYYAPAVSPVRLPEIDILDVESVLGFDAGGVLSRALAGKEGAWLVEWQAEVVDPMGLVAYYLERAGDKEPVAAQFWHLGLSYWRLRPGAVFPAEPLPQHVVGANFDHKLALLGWDDPADGQVTVYWRALNTLLQDYQISLSLEDAGGAEIGRWDGRPAGYGYPAMRWQPGQALLGRYPVPVPAGGSTGDLYISLAVYDALNPSGLDIRDVADNPAGKRAVLGPMHLEP